MEKFLVIFFIYSFCGWFMESVGGILNVKKFVNRGFLIGPYCPVYGFGVVLITLFLQKYVNDILVLYFMSLLICGTLEYFTSYIMEKIFHARWWDYHKNRFNINGRICLETLIPFGIVGTVLVKFVNPAIFKFIDKIPNNILTIILTIISILFVIDVIISFKVIFNFRKNVKKVENEVKDNTDEIVKKVKEETLEGLEELKYKISLSLHETKRHVVYKSAKLQKRIKEYRERISEELEETKEKLKKMAQKFVDSSNEFKKNFENATVEWKNKQKISRENRKKNREDITNLVKEKLKDSKLSKRLLKAFPELEIKVKEKTEK